MKKGIACMLFVAPVLLAFACKREDMGKDNEPVFYTAEEFVMGADLSYVNQILDKGGVYRDSGQFANPYLIFKEYGANVIRFRLFHTPTWTKELYGMAGTKMYDDFEDTKLGIQRAKENGMKVCLDFHYSDTWADPGKQIKPSAWENLTLEELHDSIYNYTYKTLERLDNAGLMPEYVQVGNEINPGFLLPEGNRWNGNTDNFVYLINSGIQAVRDAGDNSSIQPKIIIHIAQPENAVTWFEGMALLGLTGYDIIGISYYYLWSQVPLEQLDQYVNQLRTGYGKEVMVVETAYPWTTGGADTYNNIVNADKLVTGYPASKEGQLAYLKRLTQEIMDGGGKGIMYWEPAWITSPMKTPWGQGSAWECNTLFDFEVQVIPGMSFMTQDYDL